MTADGTNQYAYDDEGRVCAVQSPAPIAGYVWTQYIYDAEGNRVAKGIITNPSCDVTTNGFTLTNSYALGQGGEQVTETGGDGQWLHSNFYAGGQLLATYDDDGVHFQIADWLGTRRVQTDWLGRIEQTFPSLPFGELLPQNNSAFLGATEEHFTGKERDTESGNDYMFARYYNSATGRFLSPDWDAKSDDPVPYAKLDNPQSLNLYSYVYNNPVGRADADGHIALGDDAVEAGALAVIGAAAVVVAYETTPAGQRNIQNISNGTREIVGLTVTALENKISGWFSKGDKTAPAPADAKPQEPTSSAGGDTAGQRFRPADRAQDAGKKCVYCGRQTTEEPGKENSRETDHGHPRSDDGNADPKNRNPSCRTCNRQKGTKTVPQFRQWQEQNPDKVPKSMLFFPDLWRTAPWDERYSDLKIAA
jgi:RHS repeat-associated protein